MGDLFGCRIGVLVVFELLILMRNWEGMEGGSADFGVGDRWVFGGRVVSGEESLTRVGVKVGDSSGCVDSMI